MGVIAKGIPMGCQGLFTPVSLGYPLSVFQYKLYSQRRISTKKTRKHTHKIRQSTQTHNNNNTNNYESYIHYQHTNTSLQNNIPHGLPPPPFFYPEFLKFWCSRHETAFVTKWGKGSCTVRVIGIKKVQGNTRRHWGTRTEVHISS